MRLPYLDVLQLDLQVPLMMCMVLGQIEGMRVVASLPEDPDGRLHIEVDFTLTLCLPGSIGQSH